MAEETDRYSDTPAAAPGPSPVRWLVAAHVVVLAAILSFLPVLGPETGLVCLFQGVLLADGALLAIWFTLGTVPPLSGFIEFLAVVMCFCLLPWTGCTMASIWFPLVVTRSRGMRLKRFTAEDMPLPRPLQFSMRQLMWSSAAAMVLFGLGQLKPSRWKFYEAKWGALGAALAVYSTVIVGIACVAIVLTIPLVCVWAMLSPGRVAPRLATAVVGWLLGGLLIFHLAGGAGSELAFGGAVCVLGIVVLTASLGALRAMHFRAVRQSPSAASVSGNDIDHPADGG